MSFAPRRSKWRTSERRQLSQRKAGGFAGSRQRMEEANSRSCSRADAIECLSIGRYENDEGVKGLLIKNYNQVLQRKTEEAAMATKKMKELLEARKSSSHENPAIQINKKTLQQWLDHEIQGEEKEIHVEELKEQLNELVGLLQRSEARRREMKKEPKLKEHTIAIAAVATSSPMRLNGSMKNCTEHKSPSPIPIQAQKQLNYTAGIASSPIGGTAAFNKQQMKLVPIGHLSLGKKVATVGQGGKLGGGREVITNGCFNSSGNGRNHGDCQSGFDTAMKR